MENLGFGLTLMAIGMITVFAILCLVIWSSKLLIYLVNRFAPEEVVASKQPAPSTAKPVDALTMDIIRATVKELTGGKGQVMNVEKV